MLRAIGRALATLADRYTRFVDWLAGGEPEPAGPTLILSDWGRSWVEYQLARQRTALGMPDGIIAWVQKTAGQETNSELPIPVEN